MNDPSLITLPALPADGALHGDVRSRAPITDRQRAVLRFVHEYRLKHGSSATVREICEAMGIRSTNGVADHLKALERRGLIVRRDKVTRSILITVEGLAALGIEPGPTPVPSSRVHLELYATRNENARLRLLLDRVIRASVIELPKVLGDIQRELFAQDGELPSLRSARSLSEQISSLDTSGAPTKGVQSA